MCGVPVRPDNVAGSAGYGHVRRDAAESEDSRRNKLDSWRSLSAEPCAWYWRHRRNLSAAGDKMGACMRQCHLAVATSHTASRAVAERGAN
jgi:hypothetical protein